MNYRKSVRQMRRYLFLSFLFFLFLGFTFAHARESENLLNLDAEGNAKISQNDVAGARDEAIQDALEKAIHLAASFLLSMPLSDEKFEAVKNALNENADKYVSNYRITNENRESDTYSVNVNVSVLLSDLKNDLTKMGFLHSFDKDKANLVVSLQVNNLKKYTDFSRLREFLQKHNKVVKNTYSFHFEWQKANMEMEIIGTAQVLADELIRTGRYLVDTSMIDKNYMEVTCLYNRGVQK
jgi:hypothetical protein